MTDFSAAIAAAREELDDHYTQGGSLDPQPFRDLLAALDAVRGEAVYVVRGPWLFKHGDYFASANDHADAELIATALNAAPPAPAVPVLHPRTADLVQRFATALAEKLAAAEAKYGYSDDWASPDWMDECRAKLVEHVAKGDPRDVAAYAAFLWHHGDRTAPPAALAVPAEFPKCSKCGENSHPDDCQRPAKLEHEASADCWCEPELDSVDPDTGAKVWVHRETH